MSMTFEEVKLAGASDGLLSAGARRGMARLPGAAKAEYAEAYAAGRHCRRVAQGKERVASPEAAIDHAMTREEFATEFRRRPDLRQEFLSEAAFVAFAVAQRAGKITIVRKRASL